MQFKKWNSPIFLYMQIYDHMKPMIQQKPQLGYSNPELCKAQNQIQSAELDQILEIRWSTLCIMDYINTRSMHDCKEPKLEPFNFHYIQITQQGLHSAMTVIEGPNTFT